MFSAHRTVWAIIILGLLVAGPSGCGKKHLHVSTTSGAPGEGEFAMGLDDSGESNGLGDLNLSEAGLSNQTGDNDTMDTAASMDTQNSSNLGSDPIDMVAASNQAPQSLMDNNQMGNSLDSMETNLNQDTGGETSDSTPGTQIQTQSPSSLVPDTLVNPDSSPTQDSPVLSDSSLDPSSLVNPSGEGFDNLSAASSNTTSDDDPGNQNLADSVTADLPPLIAFNTLDDQSTGSTGALEGTNDLLGSTTPSSENQDGQGDSSLPVERVPENIAVAKAEPSDAFGKQLDKIAAEEAAALAAGLNDVFFEFDSWSLTPEGRQVLEHGADWLHKTTSARLLVEGHCDPRGTQAYNLVLGKKRAAAIRDYLVELGIADERVGIISYGQDKPFCSDPTEVCYQLNRRGHLLVQN